MTPDLDSVRPQPAKDATYTCPMHPQILQQGPGHCPICGMALEPVAVHEVPADDSELRSVRRKFWIAVALCVPLLGMAMLPELLGWKTTVATARVLRIAQIIVSAPVVLWLGVDYYKRGWSGVRHGSPNMYTLIGLGVVVAYIYSLCATVVYFEVSATIIALALLGEWLELAARGRTSAAIRGLLSLAPKTARRIGKDDIEEDVPLEALVVGDRVRVRPGEKVPVDGRHSGRAVQRG